MHCAIFSPQPEIKNKWIVILKNREVRPEKCYQALYNENDQQFCFIMYFSTNKFYERGLQSWPNNYLVRPFSIEFRHFAKDWSLYTLTVYTKKQISI